MLPAQVPFIVHLADRKRITVRRTFARNITLTIADRIATLLTPDAAIVRPPRERFVFQHFVSTEHLLDDLSIFVGHEGIHRGFATRRDIPVVYLVDAVRILDRFFD